MHYNDYLSLAFFYIQLLFSRQAYVKGILQSKIRILGLKNILNTSKLNRRKQINDKSLRIYPSEWNWINIVAAYHKKSVFKLKINQLYNAVQQATKSLVNMCK